MMSGFTSPTTTRSNGRSVRAAVSIWPVSIARTSRARALPGAWQPPIAGATIDRTEKVIREMSDIALNIPGIVDSVAFPGLSIAGFSAAPNEGIVFFGLEGFDQRTSPDKSKFAILGQVNGAIQQIQGARMFVVPPPAVDGLGNAGGFKLQVQDRAGLGEQALYGAVWGTLGQVYGNPKTSIGLPSLVPPVAGTAPAGAASALPSPVPR